MKQDSPKQLPVRKAILYILLSTVAISGSAFFAFLGYLYYKKTHQSDPAYHIVAIVQTSANPERIKTGYFAELFDLSIDHPTNLFSFNTQKALESLHDLSIFKEVRLSKIRPGTIHVDYTLRKPIAIWGDFSNTALDSERIPFPVKPFYTPKRLPKVYLGVKDKNTWHYGKPLEGQAVALTFSLLKMLNRLCSETKSVISSIDVSDAFVPSLGKRQIVVILEEQIDKMVEGKPIFYLRPRLLRLSPNNYQEQLGNYLSLRKYLNSEEASSKDHPVRENMTVIDLRISNLAFLKDKD